MVLLKDVELVGGKTPSPPLRVLPLLAPQLGSVADKKVDVIHSPGEPPVLFAATE